MLRDIKGKNIRDFLIFRGFSVIKGLKEVYKPRTRLPHA